MEIVKEGNAMSLANAVCLVWERLKIIPEYLGGNKMDGIKSEDPSVKLESKSTQASCSLYFCESCTVAGDTILRMIKAIDDSSREDKLISVPTIRYSDFRSRYSQRLSSIDALQVGGRGNLRKDSMGRDE
ncbi:uncharacterized protein [Prorops nasuta]|uniref:uncharacterized protein n=1 Tax=Prorops nasuta TaxID=863751 RepID=UPI0034CED690